MSYHSVIHGDHNTTNQELFFDVSVKTSGLSLNDFLYKGQQLTPLLFDIIHGMMFHCL